jgi:hypothetical protein
MFISGETVSGEQVGTRGLVGVELNVEGTSTAVGMRVDDEMLIEEAIFLALPDTPSRR